MNDTAEEPVITKSQNRIWPAWIGCFAAAFALYAATANRGAQWQDSGYFILRAVTGEAVNPLGLALTHPLHYWLSRLVIRIEAIEPAFAVTLISSLAAAVAVANMFGCTVTLTANRLAALLVAASLALANTFWHLATIAETYTLTAALLTAECWCLIACVKSSTEVEEGNSVTAGQSLSFTRKRYLAFMGMYFFNGLSLANHNLALLTMPTLVVATFWALKREWIPARIAAMAFFFWGLGSLPYTYLIVGEGLRSGDWNITLHSALFGRSFSDEVLSASVSAQRTLIILGFVLLSFPNLLLPAAAYGLRAVGRPSADSWLYRLLFLGLVIHALFAFRYPVPDQHYFFIPTYILLCLFAGVGFARWTSRQRAAATSNQPISDPHQNKAIVLAIVLLLATPLAYTTVPALLRRFDALEFFKRNKPYRDDYAYLFLPWSVSEQSADRLSREAVELAGESGMIIVEDRMAEFAVRYRVHRAARSQVAVVSELAPKDFQEAAAAGRPIVLVPNDADQPNTTHPLTGSWRRHGDLYLLDPG